MGDATLQFIGYRIVKRADLRERHLLLLVSHAACPCVMMDRLARQSLC
jgi:hypothetical protein